MANVEMERELSEDQYADLEAFECRLQQIVRGYRSKQKRWRYLLSLNSALLIAGSVFLYRDYQGDDDRTMVELLWDNMLFSCSSILFFILTVILRAFRRALSASIIAERTRKVLAHYALSIDDLGDLNLLTDDEDDQNNDSTSPSECSECSAVEESEDTPDPQFPPKQDFADAEEIEYLCSE